LSSTGSLDTTGTATDGEVEDYLITIGQPNPWHNPNSNTSDPSTGYNADVNATGVITSQDLTILWSFLFFNGDFPTLPAPGDPNSGPFPPNGPPPYLDVNGDDAVDRRDLRDLVQLLPPLNKTAGQTTELVPEGEGTSSSSLVGVALTPETKFTDEPATAAVQIATMGAEIADPLGKQEPISPSLSPEGGVAAIDHLFAEPVDGAVQSASDPADDQSLLLLAGDDNDAAALLVDAAASEVTESGNVANLSDDDLGNLLGDLFSE
jgi:hypothetical protein